MEKFAQNKSLSYPQFFGGLTAVLALLSSATATLIAKPEAALFYFAVGAIGLGVAAIGTILKNAPKNTHK